MCKSCPILSCYCNLSGCVLLELQALQLAKVRIGLPVKNLSTYFSAALTWALQSLLVKCCDSHYSKLAGSQVLRIILLDVMWYNPVLLHAGFMC